MADGQHKASAVEFLTLSSAGNIDDAYARFTAADGKHHSAFFAAGFDALKEGMKQNHAQFPHKQMTVLHVVGDGDMVAVHSHVVLKPGDPGIATLHLFRFEDGKIAELWDFAQPIKPDLPNQDGIL